MVHHHRTPLILCSVLAALSLPALPACHVGRRVSFMAAWHPGNHIRHRGFRYVRRGLEARYRVEMKWPRDRARAVRRSHFAQEAYLRLCQAAGGLRPDQALVNLVVEATHIGIATGGSLRDSRHYLVVHAYADLVQFNPPAGRRGPGPPPPPPPPG